MVGGIFGVGGYALQQLFAELLAKSDGTGFYTDTVALSVGVTAVVARFAFGAGGLLGARPARARAADHGRRLAGGGRAGGSRRCRARAGADVGAVAESVVTGRAARARLGRGGGVGGRRSSSAVDASYAGAATLIGFGVSASLLALLVVGASVPVTHHMTLPAAVAAGFVVAAGGSALTAVAVGALCGLLGALLGELCARLFLIHGDTHVDPPALAIALMTTAIVLTDLAL